MNHTINKCESCDFDAVLSVINDASLRYKGIIPDECWCEPYMTKEYLKEEFNSGVVFYSYKEEGKITGVMALQVFGDIALVRHAYVKSNHQRKGIGSKLLKYILGLTSKPILVGTWRNTFWSIRFYVNHGFRLLSDEQLKAKGELLKKYWKNITDLHREASVVLADKKWCKIHLSEE